MNQKRFIISMLVLLFCFLANAGVGDWTVYSAYHDAQRTVYLNGKVFILSDGGLYSYDPDDTSVETYDKATVLSDFGIYDIRACEATNELVILYSNGNIDLLDSDGDVYNMSDLKLKTLSDKTINDLYLDGTDMYISTNSGLVTVDLSNRVFPNYYNLGYTIYSTTVVDSLIYAATSNGIYTGNKSKNLLNVNNWTKIRNNAIERLVNLNGSIFAVTSTGVYSISQTSPYALTRLTSEVFTFTNISIVNDLMYVSNSSNLVSFDVNGNMTSYSGTGIYSLSYGSSSYWAACGSDGLKGVRLNDSAFEETVSSVIPDSPLRNYSYSLTMESGNRLLVAGGAFNYPSVDLDGTAMKYEDGKWSYFDEDAAIEIGGAIAYKNVTDIIQDPDDSEHHFLGTMRSGIYEFQDYKLVNHYTYTNSPLESILPDDVYARIYVRITGLAYDSEKNIWMCNNQCDTIVRIFRNDGTWTSLYINEISGYPTFDHIVFDERGWAWINSRRTTSSSNAGVLIVNTNNTPGDTSDDTYKFISTFYNQDGTSYSPNLFTCAVEDLDGNMWFGTNVGPFVSYNPSDAFDSDYYFTQVKIPRDDGTGLADYLMSGVSVRCITVDAGNRKWIGTSGSGVYLVSADGLETICHFTTENSPLISDYVYSIAISGETGEVFIGTEEGLVSYQGDATDPVSDFDEDLVKVYPNPVRPEYSGKISITGLMYESNVKIVNAAGRLVNEGTSVGGEYTWDGKTKSGKRAASGVYYILAADSEGSQGVVGKFLMVK